MKQENCKQEPINADDIAEKWRRDADKAQAENMLNDIIGTADELEKHIKDVRADLVMMIKALIEKDERYAKLIKLASSLFDL